MFWFELFNVRGQIKAFFQSMINNKPVFKDYFDWNCTGLWKCEEFFIYICFTCRDDSRECQQQKDCSSSWLHCCGCFDLLNVNCACVEMGRRRLKRFSSWTQGFIHLRPLLYHPMVSGHIEKQPIRVHLLVGTGCRRLIEFLIKIS